MRIETVITAIRYCPPGSRFRRNFSKRGSAWPMPRRIGLTRISSGKSEEADMDEDVVLAAIGSTEPSTGLRAIRGRSQKKQCLPI